MEIPRLWRIYDVNNADSKPSQIEAPRGPLYLWQWLKLAPFADCQASSNEGIQAVVSVANAVPREFRAIGLHTCVENLNEPLVFPKSSRLA